MEVLLVFGSEEGRQIAVKSDTISIGDYKNTGFYYWVPKGKMFLWVPKESTYTKKEVTDKACKLYYFG